MISGYKNIALIFSTLLALCAPLYVAYTAHADLKNSPIVRFDIEAYDPRDLLYGHYLTYRIVWNLPAGTVNKGTGDSCKGGNCCLCLGPGEINPSASIKACGVTKDSLPGCTHTLHGQSWGDTTFDIGMNRFYIDETKAPLLEKDLRDKKKNLSIGLAFPQRGGKPKLEKLYVDGRPVEEYLRTLSDIPSSSSPTKPTSQP